MHTERFLIRGIGYLYVKCGTMEEVASYVGQKGELVANTDTKVLHVQDGESPGGFLLVVKGDDDFPLSNSGPSYFASTTTQTLTGTLASQTSPMVVKSHIGDAFVKLNETSTKIKAMRDCVATIIATVTAPARSGASGDANWNARVVIKRGRDGSETIIADSRQFVRFKSATPSFMAVVTEQLLAEDYIYMQASGNNDDQRPNSTFSISLVEH